MVLGVNIRYVILARRSWVRNQRDPTSFAKIGLSSVRHEQARVKRRKKGGKFERTHAGGRESKDVARRGRCSMVTKSDLRKHRHLRRRTIRFEPSGATAKAHGSTFISVDTNE